MIRYFFIALCVQVTAAGACPLPVALSSDIPRATIYAAQRMHYKIGNALGQRLTTCAISEFVQTTQSVACSQRRDGGSDGRKPVIPGLTVMQTASGVTGANSPLGLPIGTAFIMTFIQWRQPSSAREDWRKLKDATPYAIIQWVSSQLVPDRKDFQAALNARLKQKTWNVTREDCGARGYTNEAGVSFFIYTALVQKDGKSDAYTVPPPTYTLPPELKALSEAFAAAADEARCNEDRGFVPDGYQTPT